MILKSFFLILLVSDIQLMYFDPENQTGSRAFRAYRESPIPKAWKQKNLAFEIKYFVNAVKKSPFAVYRALKPNLTKNWVLNTGCNTGYRYLAHW